MNLIIQNIIDYKIIQKITSLHYDIGDNITLSTSDYQKYLSAIKLIESGYPLDYYIGELYIGDLLFNTPEGVFIPRVCTEQLIDIAQTIILDNNIDEVYDICSGTGLIGISIASKFSDIHVHMIELDNLAYQTSKTNIQNNKLINISCSNTNAFDFALYFNNVSNSSINKSKNYLILCNPPYVPDGKIDDSVRFEPPGAIYSGKDGLTFFKKFIKILPNNFPMHIILELDPRNILQAQAIINDKFHCNIIKDNEGFERFLYAKSIID